MAIALYVAAATHAQAHRGTCTFADYMYQFIVSNAYRITVLRPATQQFQPDQGQESMQSSNACLVINGACRHLAWGDALAFQSYQ